MYAFVKSYGLASASTFPQSFVCSLCSLVFASHLVGMREVPPRLSSRVTGHRSSRHRTHLRERQHCSTSEGIRAHDRIPRSPSRQRLGSQHVQHPETWLRFLEIHNSEKLPAGSVWIALQIHWINCFGIFPRTLPCPSNRAWAEARTDSGGS